MKLNEMQKLLTGNYTITVEGLTIPVKITDVKQAFGRTDVLVVPEHGRGERWSNLANLTKQRKNGKKK